jgi:erythromycin esterase
LLNDKQIINEFDPGAPTVNEEWKNWTRINSHPIRSIASSNFQDLYFFNDYVANARIVQMGEVSHGASNQNKARVRIIKYFHEVLGFNVVAFESGFYEAYFSDRIITTLSDIDAMRNSISGRWNTIELFELIRYVKSTHSTGNPLHIAGFDVKPSTIGITSRPGFFRDLINIIDPVFAEDIFEIDNNVVLYYRDRPTAINYVQQNYAELCQKYDQLTALIENNYNILFEYYDDETLSVALEASKSAREAINNINGNAYYQRDHQMAKTIIYLANELYANEKIIIWSHNLHVLEEAERITRQNGTQIYSKMMGKWLKEEFGEMLYTIGTFSYRGSVYAGQGIYPEGIIQIDITLTNSLEAILYNTRKRYCYFDLSQQIQNEGNGWMFNNVGQSILHRSGVYRIFYKPKEQFDGILFIDTEKPPDYL